jgi:hypothetical protein
VRYPCIQASSVACERVFSAAGSVVTKKRNRLCSNFVETLLFVHQNRNLVKF